MVVIIGAGPAGLSAGIKLLELGHKVTILEKMKPNRFKLCGGILTPKCYELLPDLPEEIIESKIDTINMTDRGRVMNTAKLNNPLYVIDRQIFDNWLATKFINAGGNLIYEAKVTGCIGLASKYIYYTRQGKYCMITGDAVFYACGCSGISPKETKTIGLFKASAEISIPKEECRTSTNTIDLDVGYTEPAYRWKIPKSKDVIYGLCKNKKANEECLEWTKELKPKKYTKMGTAPLTHGYNKNWVNQSKLYYGIYVIGEAIQAVDAFTMEGIYFAIRTGHVAAQAYHAKDRNIYTRDLEDVFKWVKSSSDFTNNLNRFRGIVKKLAKGHDSFFKFVYENTVATYTYPHKILYLMFRYFKDKRKSKK